MADQNSSQGRRPHFHRGRRGSERRGGERRATQHPPEAHAGRDHADVEQIMREIRARISQRHGIDLSDQQIQELAAGRLEAILEPRNVKPALLEQLRRSAAAPADVTPPTSDGGYVFDDTTLYDSQSGFLRAIRRLLNPVLKLFFDPTPLTHALNTQAGLNREAVARDAARERTQAEWNALHYEILQRLVTEVSRVSLEVQSLSMRVESLAAKVDFNERRVRSFEQSVHQARPQAVRSDGGHTSAAATPASPEAVAVEGTGDANRRRRRRRRGRRGGGAAEGLPPSAEGSVTAQEAGEFEEGDEIEAAELESTIAELADVDAASSIESQAAPPQAPEEPGTQDLQGAPEPLRGAEPQGMPEPQAEAPQATPERPPLESPVEAPSAANALAEAPPPPPDLPTQPAPPKDEPLSPAPVDHAEPGPPDR
jgi:hypothetical protein